VITGSCSPRRPAHVTWERLRPQVHVCRRVSKAVEAVDAMVQRAALN
jgi:hypothetical protein